MEPANPPFEIAIDVLPEDIDELGHVNNIVYLRWIQDVAIAHWRSAATPQQQEELVWFAIRHEIDYKHQTRLGEEVVARTWVGFAEALKFERFTEIIRVADGRVLAKGRTLWCPISRSTGKLTRVGDDVRQIFSTRLA